MSLSASGRSQNGQVYIRLENNILEKTTGKTCPSIIRNHAKLFDVYEGGDGDGMGLGNGANVLAARN